VLQHRELGDLLALKALLVVQHLTGAVAQDVRRVPALQAEHPRLEARRNDGLHQRLAGLEVLAGQRNAALVGQIHEGGDVDHQRRSAIGVGYSLLDSGVSVDHRGRDRGVRTFERSLELPEIEARLLGLGVGLGGGAVDQDYPLQVMLFLEGSDVLSHLLGRLAQGAVLLLVSRLDSCDVAGVEDRREGPHHLELVVDGAQVLLFEHARLDGCLIGVIWEGVPAAKDEPVHRGQLHEVLYLQDPVLGTLAEADRT
jgi:hypothetical protein